MYEHLVGAAMKQKGAECTTLQIGAEERVASMSTKEILRKLLGPGGMSKEDISVLLLYC